MSSYARLMGFDPERFPNAVRISDLIERGLPLAAHCYTCGRSANLDLATLPLPRGTFVPALARRFKCTRCGSRETDARPDYSRPGERLTGYR